MARPKKPDPAPAKKPAAKQPAPPATTAQQLGSLIKSARDIMRKDKGLNGDLDRLPMLTWILFLKFLDDLEQVRETEAVMKGKPFRPAIERPYRWRDWAGQMTGEELIAFINNDEATRPDGKRGAGLFAYLRGLQGVSMIGRYIPTIRPKAFRRKPPFSTISTGLTTSWSTCGHFPKRWPGG